MKKMLSILALAVFATAAQAITFNWTSSTGNDWYTPGQWACALVYSDVGTSLTEAASVVYGAPSGGYTIVATAAKDAQTQSVLSIDNTYDTGWISTPADYEAKKTGAYFLVFTQDTTYYAASVDASTTEYAWTPTAGGIGQIVSANMGTFTEGTVVPEPTALALLALGVAGLALRRRA